jgi:hypothetical protein
VSSSVAQSVGKRRQVALDATGSWNPAKVDMALRALQLQAGGEKQSLDAIAVEHGCSRETVRRARNELAALLNAAAEAAGHGKIALPIPSQKENAPDNPTTALALRRLLTITGPLPLDEVLMAWARAGGKPPYSFLPSDAASLRDWLSKVGGLKMTDDPVRPIVSVTSPEVLDRVGQFLNDALRNLPGRGRADLLDAAELAGLKATTIATTLSSHPAVTRLGRGTWALRGAHLEAEVSLPRSQRPQTVVQTRPTSFSWGSDGILKIEFSIPHGPSPVVAVPKAVAELIEGREFAIEASRKPTRLSTRNARLWGFGPIVSQLGLRCGSRAVLALNLINSTATCGPARGRGPTQ